MSDWLEIVAVVGGALVLLVILLLVRFRPNWLYRRPAVDEARIASVQGLLDESARSEVSRLVADGRRLKAIRLVRERTGASLPEAVTLVDRIGDGGPAVPPERRAS